MQYNNAKRSSPMPRGPPPPLDRQTRYSMEERLHSVETDARVQREARIAAEQEKIRADAKRLDAEAEALRRERLMEEEAKKERELRMYLETALEHAEATALAWDMEAERLEREKGSVAEELDRERMMRMDLEAKLDTERAQREQAELRAEHALRELEIRTVSAEQAIREAEMRAGASEKAAREWEEMYNQHVARSRETRAKWAGPERDDGHRAAGPRTQERQSGQAPPHFSGPPPYWDQYAEAEKRRAHEADRMSQHAHPQRGS